MGVGGSCGGSLDCNVVLKKFGKAIGSKFSVRGVLFPGMVLPWYSCVLIGEQPMGRWR